MQGNESFSELLMYLSIPSLNDLISLFPCEFCEKMFESGNKFLVDIVLHGKDIQVLTAPSTFSRRIKTLSPVSPSVASRQFILQFMKNRLREITSMKIISTYFKHKNLHEKVIST